MNRVLLDTHAFLWFIDGSPRLSLIAREAIETAGVQRLLSVASLWEAAIKYGLGKLRLGESFETLITFQLARNGVTPLEISLEHVTQTIALPHHHRDPFDRMLIAQAVVDGLPIISADAAFDAYGIQRIW